MESVQPISLKESAVRCLKSFEALKKDAKEQFHPLTSTRDLLQNFERSIDGSILILQNWVIQFTKEEQTNNDEIIIPIRQVFRTLEENIEDVDVVLSARLRLRYRRFAWVSLRREKKKLVLVLVSTAPPVDVYLERSSKPTSTPNYKISPTLSAF